MLPGRPREGLGDTQDLPCRRGASVPAPWRPRRGASRYLTTGRRWEKRGWQAGLSLAAMRHGGSRNDPSLARLLWMASRWFDVTVREELARRGWPPISSAQALL